MNDQELKDLEKNALDWFARQPMGSAVRQNGPAAIQGYMAGAADMYKQLSTKELDSYMVDYYEKLVKETKKEKERYEKTIEAAKGKVTVVTLPQ